MIKGFQGFTDYLFYRAYGFYQKYKDDDPSFMSVLVVSAFEILMIILFFLIVNNSLEYGYHGKSADSVVKACIVVLTLIILISNSQRYKGNKILTLKELWDREDAVLRKRKGWMVTGCLILPLILIILYGVLKHNLHIL